MTDPRQIVLIVDDEEDLTWSISKSLKRDKKSIRVLCANSGDEALELIKKNAVDVLVTDLRMPGKDGFALIEFIRNEGLKTRIIVMTAYGSDDIEKQILTANCCYYIEKPFEMATLKEKIYAVLQNPDDCNSGSGGGGMNYQIRKLLAMSKDIPSLMVSVYQGSREGKLYFSRGRIYHAEVGKKNGQAALEEIFSWPQGIVKAQTGISSRVHTLNVSHVK